MGTFDLTPWLKIPLIKDEDINSKTLVRSKITKKLIYLTLLFRGEPITFHHKKTDELEKLTCYSQEMNKINHTSLLELYGI